MIKITTKLNAVNSLQPPSTTYMFVYNTILYFTIFLGNALHVFYNFLRVCSMMGVLQSSFGHSYPGLKQKLSKKPPSVTITNSLQSMYVKTSSNYSLEAQIIMKNISFIGNLIWFSHAIKSK